MMKKRRGALVTDRRKMLYHYTYSEPAKRIMSDGFLMPTNIPEDDYRLAFPIGNVEIPIPFLRYEIALDAEGNARRISEAPCIFLTESYPCYENNVGINRFAARFAFPISTSEIFDQGFRVYRSHRIFSKNIYVVPDPDARPLKVDVSKTIELDWKWKAYAYLPSLYLSPLQAIWRLVK
jgi:hypothetical protein